MHPSDLLTADCYPHAVGRVELVETHISWVFLAGDYAYKIKKPVHLPFLDFSTLKARRKWCEEELRLNRRTAPELYLGVVPIAGSASHPRISGQGRPIEYALRMRRFGQDALAVRMAERGELSDARIDALAGVVYGFHAGLAGAAAHSRHGTHARVTVPALENIEELKRLVANPEERRQLQQLHGWTRVEGERLRAVFAARKREGLVRECHGDLHLGNIAWVEGRPLPFDCIEFSAEWRWIDVMSEVAFLTMDLFEHRLDAGAWRFLNAYLEASGDYGGGRVLRYYLVYRALVRAKIALIRGRQSSKAGRGKYGEQGRYVGLAGRLARPRQPALVLMHGLAGSGKTAVSQMLAETTGAIRVRSDVERKRLRGLAVGARTHAGPQQGIYAPDTTRLTYARLKSLVRDIAGGGFTAIVDAAFLRRKARTEFCELAAELRLPLLIVSCQATDAERRRRVLRREAALNDASEAGVAVLENQMITDEPLVAGELALAEAVDTGCDRDILHGRIEAVAARLARLQAAVRSD